MESAKPVALWLPLEAGDGLLDFDSVDGDLLLLDVENLKRRGQRALLTLDGAVDANGQVLALILPGHFNRLHIVQVLHTHLITSRNS